MRKLGLSLVAALGTAAAFASTPATAQDIAVATAGPITGQYASFGEQMKRGAEQAVADLNAAGGVLGKKLRLEVGDDACDPKQARAVAEDLVSKGVIFVAGHFCSSSSIPASEVYAEADVLQMTPASTNPALTEGAAEKGWKNVFRTCGRDDAQGLVAGKYIAEKYAGKNVAIIHDKSTYGKGIADETKKAMNAAGLQETMYEAINQGDKDYSALVSKMKAGNIDVIYAGLYHTEAGLIIRQAREQGLKAQMISEDALVTNEFWAIAGDAGEGTLMTFAPDPRNLPTAKDVVAKFKAQGYDPEGYTLYTYAAMQVWAKAAEKAGSTDVAKLAEVIRGNTFETVLGTLDFDDKGDVVNPEYVFYVWSKGQYKELGS
ncbi:MAG TPA: branched-chain amino acid ABC transporter substrate-binding protein [Alphaproteobacteria bacterium]|nr:branched-chain amino acid ABC transporter substrate-binding protein [Alphaproteobacteria bacterium]